MIDKIEEYINRLIKEWFLNMYGTKYYTYQWNIEKRKWVEIEEHLNYDLRTRYIGIIGDMND